MGDSALIKSGHKLRRSAFLNFVSSVVLSFFFLSPAPLPEINIAQLMGLIKLPEQAGGASGKQNVRSANGDYKVK